MTNQKILTKAIEKAIAGGWHFDIHTDEFEVFLDTTGSPSISQLDGVDLLDYQRIIFNHDFAKALWGEEILTNREDKYDFLNKGVTTEDHEPTGTDYDYPMWMWHLQQMVIADDPIKYLGENT